MFCFTGACILMVEVCGLNVKKNKIICLGLWRNVRHTKPSHRLDGFLFRFATKLPLAACRYKKISEIKYLFVLYFLPTDFGPGRTHMQTLAADRVRTDEHTHTHAHTWHTS